MFGCEENLKRWVNERETSSQFSGGIENDALYYNDKKIRRVHFTENSGNGLIVKNLLKIERTGSEE